MRQHGFTLVEMLVTLSIVVLLIGLSFPVFQAMMTGSRTAAGETTVGGAVEVARAYLERERFELDDPLPLMAEGATIGEYKGIALLFAPSGEIRITRTNPVAYHMGDGMLHMLSETGGDGTVYLTPRYGFEDLPDREYIDLPRGVRVLGVTRDDAGGEPRLIEPPFAVRFNEYGQLVAHGEPYPDSVEGRRLEDRVVIYDSNLNGSYEYDQHRGNNTDYSYDEYDAEENFNADFGRHEFPIERIETVIGLRFENVRDPSDHRYLMFSRYTGAPMRRE